MAAGALVDETGRVLLTRRHDHAHQGGLWEFPGGKLEPGESALQALHRELGEELGIAPQTLRPLIRVQHGYPECEVVLHLWRIERWRGEPRGREGQPLAWVAPEALDDYPMPAADRPVVQALRLPDRYIITPPRVGDPARLLAALDRLPGLGLLQFRVFESPAIAPEALFAQVRAHCHARGARVLFNGAPEQARALGADGVHLSSRLLRRTDTRPAGLEWVAASCHDAEDLAQARALGVDFAVLSPVLPTRSHPDAEPLRWEGFSRHVQALALPVYALGGMTPARLAEAWQAGAQGVAGIRGFWPDEAF